MTLNQVIRRIRTLALSHKQLRSFDQNKFTQEFLNAKTTLFPCALLHNTSGTISTSAHAVSLSFRFFLLDLVNVSEDTKTNELDVQSDMLQIALDLLAQINYPGYDDWLLSTDNALQLLAEDQNDMVAGCYFDFTIRAMFTQNVCQIPTEISDYEPTEEDMKHLYDLEYIATGTEGKTLTIPAIAGKKIMLMTRENGVLYKVSNQPDTTEYVWDYAIITLGLDTKPNDRFLILYRTI